MAGRTYAQDVAFLSDHAKVLELSTADDGKVAVVPQYQGRIMTSSLAGREGASFGWINEAFISAGKDSDVFNNYGGEDRFWLGPEGGQYALWFKAGQPFDLEHWKTPAGFNCGEFDVESHDAGKVVMTRRFEVANFSGMTFQCSLRRTVSVIDRQKAGQLLGGVISDRIRMVGFESFNELTNNGSSVWTRENGLVSIWILGQFKPLPDGKVIVPFRSGSTRKLGPRANTEYFGKIPPQRCVVKDDHVLFTCDGRHRSKIGVAPGRALDVLGSFDPRQGLLTIVQFSLPPQAGELPYVNSLWQMQDHPYAGDVVNSYNDGPNDDGSQLGPFYELETSSPAAELKIDQTISHTHRTFHFQGERADLVDLGKRILGVDLAMI